MAEETPETGPKTTRGGWTDLLSVPGNIKQQFLPFVINPKYKDYTKVVGKSRDLKEVAA